MSADGPRLSQVERDAFEDRWRALESQGIGPDAAFAMLEASHPTTASRYLADRVDDAIRESTGRRPYDQEQDDALW